MRLSVSESARLVGAVNKVAVKEPFTNNVKTIAKFCWHLY